MTTPDSIESQVIPIDQVICTIQGEGQNSGIPSLLIRTKGCNLSCPFCDSKRTWQIKPSDFTLSIDNLVTVSRQIIDTIKNDFQYKIKCLMLTGGEPSIYFDNIVYRNFISSICEGLDLDIVEIETNAAFRPFSDTENFFQTLATTRLNQKLIFNISPKLKSDMELVKQNILWCYNNRSEKIDFTVKVVFSEDLISQFEKDILPILTPMDSPVIYIMPMTPYKGDGSIKKDEYLDNCHRTIEYCLTRGFKYCGREHIWLFGSNVNEHKLLI